MKVIFLGAPGAGKGTIADLISKEKSIPHISTGDIFRKEIADKTKLGLEVKHILESGKLVPDDLTIEIIKHRIKQDDCKNGFILDGFPRTIPQADALDKITKIDLVINFDIDQEFIIKRLLSRRFCPNCKRTYNLLTSQKPKKEGVCDACSTAIIQRADDSEKVIRDRMNEYNKQTAPLIDYYKKKKLLKNVDATGIPEEIAERVMKVI